MGPPSFRILLRWQEGANNKWPRRTYVWKETMTNWQGIMRIGLYLGILDWPLFIRISKKINMSRRLGQVPIVPVCRNTKECKRWKTMNTLFYSTLSKKFSICSQVVGEGGRRWKLLMPCANSEVPQGTHLLFDNSCWLFGGVHSVLASLLKWTANSNGSSTYRIEKERGPPALETTPKMIKLSA